MADVIFFGQDAHDPAVQRRIKAFETAGARVVGFTMRRGPAFDTPWTNVDLGRTHDAAFAQRMAALVRAAPKLSRERNLLKRADVFYARNLDMLALAHWAKRWTGSNAAIVYECLDVHRFMARNDPLGASMRGLERSLLGGTSMVVVSSPAFLSEYFERRHPNQYCARLIENRLPAGYDYGPRPSGPRSESRAIRIGWFGNLRCRRSLGLLLDLADRLPDRVQISMRGAPARTEIGDFEQRVSGRPNVTFGGRYSWPGDLAEIYRDVDIVWAGDFHDPGANSAWLLPNRIYEGGYYGVPPLAPAASETGRWITDRKFGFTLAEPLEDTLLTFFDILNRPALQAARARLLEAPQANFLQPEGELGELLAAVMEQDRVAAR